MMAMKDPFLSSFDDFFSLYVGLDHDLSQTIFSCQIPTENDSTPPHRDQISGDLIPVSQVNIPAREMAMLANLLLIILGILEVIFTLPSFIICLREICYCYSDSEVLMAAAAVAGSAEQERKLLTKNFLYVVTTYLF